MVKKTLLRFSWPPKELSPNSRKDRRAATPMRKAYRHEYFWAAKQAKADIPADAHLDITFHPPDHRKRDLDNMLALIKSGLDGLAAATCEDDSGWSLTIAKGEPVKGGAVLVQFVGGDE